MEKKNYYCRKSEHGKTKKALLIKCPLIKCLTLLKVHTTVLQHRFNYQLPTAHINAQIHSRKPTATDYTGLS